MNWEAGANCFLLKAVYTYGKDWDSVSTALQTIAKTFLRDEKPQDLSKQSCSLQYNYIIASTRQKNMHEMDEATLFKVALDYYTTQRREKLHATRLELLKKMKIAEEDAEKLRDGRFSEIPMNRLTVYRKRCRAFGIADIIGEQLKLDPLPPATETENQTIRESLTVPEFLNRSIGDEITDPNGGRWFPLRGTFRDVFGYKSEADEQNAISEFLNAQAFLCRRIGTEFPEDETSSLDTSSSVRTHPEDPPIPVPPECPETSMMEPVVVEVTETASKAPTSPSADPLSTQAHPTKLLLPRHNPAPLSPCSSSALVSDTDTLASPPVGQSHTSSPSVGQSDPQSPSLRLSARRARNKRSRKRIIQTAASMTSGDLDHALSPVVSECGTTDDGTTNSTALLDVTLARRWRRGLLSALSTVCSHRHAYVFMHPVTEDIAPGYSSVVYEPVDLTSLRRRLEAALASLASGTATSATVPTPKQLLIDAATRFIRDLMLMFVNARMYNSSNHEVHKMAGDMFNDVIGELKPLWSVLVEDISGFPSLPSPTRLSVPIGLRNVTRPPVASVTPTTSPTSATASRNPETPITKIPAPSTRSAKRPASKSTNIASPPRKRHQSSSSDVSMGTTTKSK